MIRHGAGIAEIVKSVRRLGIACLVVASSLLLPHLDRVNAMPAADLASNGADLKKTVGSWLVRTGLCPDGRPCADADEAGYTVTPGHGPRWEQEQPYYLPEAADDDCVEDRHAARAFPVRTPPPPRFGNSVYEEPCGIRCWYRRLREGYCGRGCDYYRFRMTAFPEGNFSRPTRRVACRTAR